MSNQYRATAPKWAIKMHEVFTYFSRDKREEEAYGVLHSGRLALQVRFDCSFDSSMSFFQDVKPEHITESDSFSVQRMKTITQWVEV